MYKAILAVIKQEIQARVADENVDFTIVKKLAEAALDFQAAAITNVEEVNSFQPVQAVPHGGQAYGPGGMERMISEVIPQFMPIFQQKFANDALNSLSALLETYLRLKDSDPELAAKIKDRINQALHKEVQTNEDIHTDVPG